MRVTDRLFEAGAGDDYTPATDLVFSMLALTLLLLAIFGAGSHVTESRSLSTIGDLAGDKATLVAELDAARKTIAELEAAGPPSTQSATIVRLKRDIDVLQRQYETKTRQYEEIMDELARVQKLAKADLRLPPITRDTHGAFLGADDRISASVLETVRRGLRAQKGAVLGARFNEVTISVETGMVPDRSTPEGPDDETFETFKVAVALQQGLWTTPLPPACVVIEPIGKARASGLVDRLTQPDAGPLMEALVRGSGALAGQITQSRLGAVANRDRRIFVSLRRTESGPCTSEALETALGSL